MVTIATLCYLTVGVIFIVWFLTDAFRAKSRVDNGDGTTSDKRVITLLKPFPLLKQCLFLLIGWPVALVMYVRSGPDDEGDSPEDRVPPEYR